MLAVCDSLAAGFLPFWLGLFFLFSSVCAVYVSVFVCSCSESVSGECVCVCAVCISVCVSDFRLSVFDELVCLVQCVALCVSVHVSDLQKNVVALNQYLMVECVWCLCFSLCVRLQSISI